MPNNYVQLFLELLKDYVVYFASYAHLNPNRIMKKNRLPFYLFFVSFHLLAQNNIGLTTSSIKNVSINTENLTDIDNNSYTTIQIGSQVWMAENLKVTHYRNGDNISNIQNDVEWANLNTGAYCHYGNDPKNGEKFGNLYNFYAVADVRNIAPVGWHVATDAEWTILKDYLISKGFNFDPSTTEDFTAKAMAASSDWDFSNTPGMPGYDVKKNNTSLFNALPGSFRFTAGEFVFPIGSSANFWTSTPNQGAYAWNRYITNDLGKVSRDSGKKCFGFSVRCVKGEQAIAIQKSEEIPIVTDIDKNSYTTIQIGSQIWMAENLKVTHFRNGDRIPNIQNDVEWANLTTGAYCHYGNNPENSDKFGNLYNFYAVADVRNIAPAGWHVPTDAEWDTLTAYLIAKGYNFDGSTTGNFTSKSISASYGWSVSAYPGMPGCDMEKNNSSHFNALPGSNRFTAGAFVFPIGSSANFWTSTPSHEAYAWNRYIVHNLPKVSRDSGKKYFGFSVRCIKGE